MRVVWTTPALSEILAIYDYLFDFNPVAAERVTASLRMTAHGLATFPNRGRLVPGTTMREIVTTYPYVIRYRVAAQDVIILRIRHTSRRPTNP